MIKPYCMPYCMLHVLGKSLWKIMNLVILSSFFIFVRKEFSFRQSGDRCSLMWIRERIAPPMMSEGVIARVSFGKYCEGDIQAIKHQSPMKPVPSKDARADSYEKCYATNN
uniref:Uncharacterized protein n=1 Tax=Glossina pallidipes TaxID=7398 RepID=A0A1A9ZKJ2_GLOPL